MVEHSESLFIAGEWKVAGSGAREVRSPIDGEVFAAVPLANAADVDAAVAAARSALHSPDWRDLAPADRSALLVRFAEELEATAEVRANLVTRQNGMTLTLARAAEGLAPVKLLRYYGTLLLETPDEERRARADGVGDSIVRREPVGVVAAIVPWNYPQSLAMFKIAPALAAGCTVVLKPAPETTLDALELAAAAERAGLPAGALNIVTGGVETGTRLVGHPGVDKVAFTGSVAAGKSIGATCGQLLRPVTLELGGKSAAIVLDDADLAPTVQGLASAFMLNSGQTCYLSSRVLVPRSRHDEVLEALAATTEALVVGNPLDPGTHVGPVVNSAQRDRVENLIAAGKSEGARLVTGGGRPGLDKGWYVQPTVFADVDNSSRIAREEFFGPVLTVTAYDGVEDAIALANDSDFGLAGTIWTADAERAVHIARRMETGSVGINFFQVDVKAPFGGYKDSGLGRELGPEGLDAYVQLKSIHVPYSEHGA